MPVSTSEGACAPDDPGTNLLRAASPLIDAKSGVGYAPLACLALGTFAIGTDAFMTTLLADLGIDTEHHVKVFNAKTSSLRAFCDFLRGYLDGTQPANRPSISVFVLPSKSVKENAFKLFRELAAAARLFGEDEYAEIYGFDDGDMPRYG